MGGSPSLDAPPPNTCKVQVINHRGEMGGRLGAIVFLMSPLFKVECYIKWWATCCPNKCAPMEEVRSL